MSLPDDLRIQVSIPLALADEALADMEAWGRRAPVSFRRVAAYLQTARENQLGPDAPVPDKAPSERPVPS
jgi:hypothetical protein